MIDSVSTVSIFVNNQDKAMDFYVNKLGFEVRQDMPMGPDSRWLSVAPKGAVTEIVLYKIDQNWEHWRNVMGKSTNITLAVTDMASLAKDLKAKGVKFTIEPETQPWGTQAMIVDHEGNGLLLVEVPKR